MRPSPVEPFSPDPCALHPMLQKALDHLDVQLENELTRYRQQRYRQLGEKTRVQDLVNPPNTNLELQQAAITPPISAPDYAPDYAESSSLDLDVWDTEASHYPAQSNSSHLSNFDARRVVREMRVTSQTPQGSPPSWQPELTHDYFASSEELLRSFPHPEVTPIKRQSSLLEMLLTPLGVGSMLLLLLSSVSLGYIIMHPSSLGFLAALGRDRNEAPIPTALPNGDRSLSPNLASDEFIDVNLNTLSQLPRSDRPSTVVTVPQTASPTLSPTLSQTEPSSLSSTSTSPSVASDAPRLAAAITEAPLQTVTIPSRPVVRQAEPAPVSAPARSVPARPAPARAPAPVPPAPEPISIAPAPQSASKPAPEPASTPAYAPPAPPTSIAQAPPSTSRYYVVTEYTGDPSLSKARQAVDDAYVRNFNDGAKVQMGSFEDAASAEQLAQQLQQQGVPAQVYQP